ncbi:MAG: uridine kinase [Ignavibacteriales bacterium]|nr:uridine kinase [Ignavibacteriales bacterium]
MEQLVIGIAGGTGSGKTTVTQKILERLHVQENVVVIQHDAYYKDLTAYKGLTPDKINFDHPDSLETSLLIAHIRDLKQRRAVQQPIYNFTTHSRLRETRELQAKDIILIEGILIFVDKELRDLMDIKIFVDTDADERLLRRIRRDILERGRSIDSVMNQYIATVKPMHLEFVEPSKHWADIIIPRGGDNLVAIDMVTSKIENLLLNKHTLHQSQSGGSHG